MFCTCSFPPYRLAPDNYHSPFLITVMSLGRMYSLFSSRSLYAELNAVASVEARVIRGSFTFQFGSRLRE